MIFKLDKQRIGWCVLINFFKFCRLLNIFSHVLEDTTFATSANPKAVLDAAREAITSPIKKRVSNKQETQATESQTEPKTAKGEKSKLLGVVDGFEINLDCFV